MKGAASTNTTGNTIAAASSHTKARRGTVTSGEDNSTTGNSVSFTNASLEAGAGQALTITITGTVGPGTTGPLVNTATVSAGAGHISVLCYAGL